MEIWKDILDFPGYQVSNKGRVRSFWYRPTYGRGAKRAIGVEPRIMPMSDDGNGYLKVCLKKGGKNYMRKIHRLVAEAFLPAPPDPSYTVDHIQSGPVGKLDNSVENLQWLTRGDNIRKAWRDGANEPVRLTACQPVLVTDTYDDHSIFFRSIKDAAYYLGIDLEYLRHHLYSSGGVLLINGLHAEFVVEVLDSRERMYYRMDERWEEGGFMDYDGWHN